jgi:hypothetical protein
MTKSLSIACDDLKLEELIVVKPTGAGYDLEDRIRVMSLEDATAYCGELTH